MILSASDWDIHDTQLCTKCSEGNLTPLDLSQAPGVSYDLTIKGIDVRDGGARLHQTGRSFSLRPGSCVVLETAEHVVTGDSVFGFICSRASLSARGLIVSNLKVDANYSDTLYVTAVNASTQPIKLSPGDAFCAIVFVEMARRCSVKARRPDIAGVKWALRSSLMRSLPYIVTYIGSVATAVLAVIAIMQMVLD